MPTARAPALASTQALEAGNSLAGSTTSPAAGSASLITEEPRHTIQHLGRNENWEMVHCMEGRYCLNLEDCPFVQFRLFA